MREKCWGSDRVGRDKSIVGWRDYRPTIPPAVGQALAIRSQEIRALAACDRTEGARSR